MAGEANAGLQVDIDAIVRQVLDQLSAASPENITGASSRTNGEGAAGKSDEWVLTGRVVSTSDLEDRLTSVRRLVLRPGAVVTPAARDLLRDKNIVIEFRASNHAAQAKHRLVVGQADTDFDPAELVRALGPDVLEVERLAKTGLTTVVDEMCSQVSKGGQLGLLFAGRSAAAICLANRCRGVRAAVGSDAGQIEQAVAEIGVNLLVVEPTRRSSFELMKMTRGFLRGGERCCPEYLQSKLG